MITVIGSMNMDLVVTTERAPEQGETVTGKEFRQIPGGKGANQAVAAARSGADVVMVGRIGDDAFGDALLRTMAEDPIDITHIQKVKDVPTGIASITVDRRGHNRIIVVPGANGTFTPEDIESYRSLIARSNVLLLQHEIPLKAVEKAIMIAREEGVFCILNPAPATALPNFFYQYVDLMTPNESELSLLSGKPTDERAQWLEAGNVLLNLGLSTLIVTLGQHGSLIMNNKGSAHFPAYRVQMIDSTAAGDSFNGTLAAEIDRMITQRNNSTVRFSPSIDDLTPAIDYATKAAAISVTRSGAQPSIPWHADITQFDAWFASHRL